MERFKGKYRIPSARLTGWDYASAGWYFVTLVTHVRLPYFGEIVRGEMRLSPIGEIVAEEWQKTAQIRPSVQLDEWVVMPNHIHGILVITVETPMSPVETPRAGRLYAKQKIQIGNPIPWDRSLTNTNPPAPNASVRRGMPNSPGSRASTTTSSATKNHCSESVRISPPIPLNGKMTLNM